MTFLNMSSSYKLWYLELIQVYKNDYKIILYICILWFYYIKFLILLILLYILKMTNPLFWNKIMKNKKKRSVPKVLMSHNPKPLIRCYNNMRVKNFFLWKFYGMVGFIKAHSKVSLTHVSLSTTNFPIHGDSNILL